MNRGSYVCGYLSGMRTSAKVILRLTDTSVYSGGISPERSSSCPGPKTSGTQSWTVYGTLVFWVGISIVCCTETWREVSSCHRLEAMLRPLLTHISHQSINTNHSDALLIHATTRMNLKTFMRRGRSQIQMVTHCMIPSYGIFTEWANLLSQKAEWWLPGAGESGDGSDCLKDSGFLWGDGSVLKLNRGSRYTTSSMY